MYRAVRNIPAGRVATYADVARACGWPQAWRAVGNILNQNRDPKTPCHRVVRSDSTVGGFGFPGGRKEKIRWLVREGVAIKDGRVDLTRFQAESGSLRSMV